MQEGPCGVTVTRETLAAFQLAQKRIALLWVIQRIMKIARNMPEHVQTVVRQILIASLFHFLSSFVMKKILPLVEQVRRHGIVPSS